MNIAEKRARLVDRIKQNILDKTHIKRAWIAEELARAWIKEALR